MLLIEVIVLAIVQALTEFIPVSSSGHLIGFKETFNIEGNLAFDVMLHVGTLIALVIYFRKTILKLTKDLFSNRSKGLISAIVISTMPAVIVGGLFQDFFEDSVREIEIVIAMLAVVGIFMIFAEKIFSKVTIKDLNKLTSKNALIIGLWQVLALVPGTSRSGITILAGRGQGMSNPKAAEYSFLIGIPVIFGAAVRIMIDSEARAQVSDDLSATIIGVIVAAAIGIGAIHFVITWLKNHSLALFGYYRIALSLVLLLLVAL